eukprot:38337-Chlamydomonas_euryale.AAC.8
MAAIEVCISMLLWEVRQMAHRPTSIHQKLHKQPMRPTLQRACFRHRPTCLQVSRGTFVEVEEHATSALWLAVVVSITGDDSQLDGGNDSEFELLWFWKHAEVLATLGTTNAVGVGGGGSDVAADAGDGNLVCVEEVAALAHPPVDLRRVFVPSSEYLASNPVQSCFRWAERGLPSCCPPRHRV